MHLPFSLFFSLLLSLAALTPRTEAQSPGLIEVLSKNPNTTVLHGLVAANSQLDEFYSSLPENSTTCFLPNDEAFWRYGNSSWGARVLKDADFVFDMLAYPCVQGVYGSSSFSSNASDFLHSRWSSPGIENVHDGQVLEAVRQANGSALYSGLGTSLLGHVGVSHASRSTSPQLYPGPRQKAFIVETDIPFRGGLLQILDDWMTVPSNATVTAQALDLTAASSAAGYDTLFRGDMAAAFTVMVGDDASWKGYFAVLGNLSWSQQLDIWESSVFDEVLYSDAFTTEGSEVMDQAGGNVTLKGSNGGLVVDEIRVEEMLLTANGALFVLHG
jgi:hypothetical protein